MSDTPAHLATNVLDFAAARTRRAARARSAAGIKQMFLWGWPATGQLLAAEFPLPAAASYSLSRRSL